jgi:hypothetical protein
VGDEAPLIEPKTEVVFNTRHQIVRGSIGKFAGKIKKKKEVLA